MRDLRCVLAAVAIAEELERIGDHAAGIARLVERLPEPPATPTLIALGSLATLARLQLQAALTAYRATNPAQAAAIWRGDRALDEQYARLVQAVLESMGSDPQHVLAHTYVLWIAHNLERIGDRATNIGERVVFIATGSRRLPVAS